MDFIKQYLKIISYICSGLVFAFASFYLLANLYHYFELRKDYITNYDEQLLVIKVNDTLNKIKENADSFDPNTYKGNISTNNMLLIKNGFNACISSFNNETVTAMHGKNKITILDVYNLREAYENSILNRCIVGNMYWLATDIDESFGSTYLFNSKEINKMYIDSLLSSTSYLKKDLLNNSSYYYNTAIASSSMLDNTRDGFYEVMDAYNRAANFVLYLSDWFKMESEG